MTAHWTSGCSACRQGRALLAHLDLIPDGYGYAPVARAPRAAATAASAASAGAASAAPARAAATPGHDGEEDGADTVIDLVSSGTTPVIGLERMLLHGGGALARPRLMWHDVA
jgi:hypothetical protein